MYIATYCIECLSYVHLVFYGLAATLIIVFVNYPFPSTMKGILYYVQVSLGYSQLAN